MNRLWNLFALASLTCLECTQMQQVPNVPVYADKGKFGAVMAYTRGEPQVTQIPKLKWDQIRVGMYCMDAQSLGDYKKFIETACLNDKNCIDGARRLVNALQGTDVWGK